jgi:N-acyl-D-amino-acid deacylase
MRPFLAALACSTALTFSAAHAQGPAYDLVIRGGDVYDGTGAPALKGDVAIKGDKIVYVGPKAPGRGAREIDATGRAVTPGFINMLSWSTESLFADGRGLSELKQGVTLEVMGEGNSMGPWSARMKEDELKAQGDIRFAIPWTSLDEYLRHMESRGVSQNLASFVGATTVRVHVLGMDDVDPTPAQLEEMRALVRKAMEDGAMGVGSSLIYAPAAYAETDELTALVGEAGKCGGFYISHMRSEGSRLVEAVDELIEISRRTGTPAEIYHLKASGQANWDKLDTVLARIDAARAKGQRITTDMYTYPAGSTGLDAAMPVWVQAGGTEAWIARLKDPATRAKVIEEMRSDTPAFENLQRQAGAAGTLLVGFKNSALKPLTGRTLADVAKERGKSTEDTAIDLVIEDGSRVQVVYFLMSDENVARQTALPYMSFGSDAEARAPEGVFLQSSTHPRAYGNFARVFAKYVRDEKRLTLADAVRKMTSLPAHNLGLKERGLLKAGYYADVVVFDPATIQDHATFDKPQQLATGVQHVVVNGQLALENSEATAARPGRVVRGRGWTGWKDGGCRKSAGDWKW